MPANQARRYCFTKWIRDADEHLFWSSKEDVSERLPHDLVRYCCWQIEVPGENHLAHVQGYFEFKKLTTLAGIKRLPLPGNWPEVHIEASRGSAQQNIDYCTKEDTRLDGPWTFGESAGEGGAPSLEEAARGLLEHRNLARTAREAPDLFVRHNRGLEALLRITDQPSETPDIVLRPWQDQLLKIIDAEPHDRRIYWIWEPYGGTGKSFFARYLICNRNALFLTNGRHDRLLNAWNRERVVIFDFSRDVVTTAGNGDTSDRVPYSPMEHYKNGVVWSGFAGARQMVGPKPHVICFANFEPNYGKLSLDRWTGGVFRVTEEQGLEETPINL